MIQWKDRVLTPNDSAQKAQERGIQMDCNLEGSGRLCLAYVRGLNALMKKITFATYSSTFYDCDCDKTWVNNLYEAIMRETGCWNKLKYGVLKRLLPINDMYVRKLCLLDSIVGLAYLEKSSYENRRRHAYIIEHIIVNEGNGAEGYQDLDEAVGQFDNDIQQLRQTRYELLDTFCVDADELSERLDAENLQEGTLYDNLLRMYNKKCQFRRTLEAFGHRAMGGLTIDYEGRSVLVDVPAPPPEYKLPLYSIT